MSESSKRWWILRATYGQELKALEYIAIDGRDSIAFSALRHVEKPVGNTTKRVLDTLIPGIIFVYCTERQAQEYVNGIPQTHFLSFLYDASDKRGAVSQPAYADYDTMMNFIKAVTVDTGAAKRVSDEYIHYKDDNIYVVTSGDYKGVKGRLARVCSQSCIVVELPGVARIITRYIPSACVSKVGKRPTPECTFDRRPTDANGLSDNAFDSVSQMLFRMKCWQEIGNNTSCHTLSDYTSLLEEAPRMSRNIVRRINAMYSKGFRCSEQKINEQAELLVTALLAQFFCPWYGLDSERLVQSARMILKRLINKQLLCYLCVLLFALCDRPDSLKRNIDGYMSSWNEDTLTPEDKEIRKFYQAILGSMFVSYQNTLAG